MIGQTNGVYQDNEVKIELCTTPPISGQANFTDCDICPGEYWVDLDGKLYEIKEEGEPVWVRVQNLTALKHTGDTDCESNCKACEMFGMLDDQESDNYL